MAACRTVLFAAALSLAGCAVGCKGCTLPSPDGELPKHLTLVYFADVAGQLEPCGCSANQRGGLPRAAEAVARIRKENPHTYVIGGGDLLFEKEPAKDDGGQEKRKAQAVGEILKGMGFAASVPGERDLYLGADFARSTGIGFLETTSFGPVAFGALGKVPAGRLRVAVVHQGGTAAAAGLAEQAKKEGILLLLAAHRDEILKDDVNRALLDAAVPVVQVQGRGQSFARIDLYLNGDPGKPFVVLKGNAEKTEELDLLHERKLEYIRRKNAAEGDKNEALAQVLGDKIVELDARARKLADEPVPGPPEHQASIAVTFIPVDEKTPEDATAKAAVDRYHADVARSNLAAEAAHPRACPPPGKDEPFFTGIDEPASADVDSCATCHKAAVAFWKKTKHATAYHSLEEKGRQYDLDCVSCHVTGWMRPGGACSIARTEKRQNVQCENCHGPSSAHAADPDQKTILKPDERTCVVCHNPENSTGFEYSSYRKKILGPGHGSKALERR
jgi:hypothetical protein